MNHKKELLRSLCSESKLESCAASEHAGKKSLWSLNPKPYKPYKPYKP